MKNHFILMLAVLSFIGFSCTPDLQEETTITESGFAAELFYIDDVQVSQDDFPYEDESFYIAISPENNQAGEEMAIFKAFSNKEAYINWGIEKGYQVALSLKIEEDLKSFIQENEIAVEYERTGEIPQRYLDFQEKYYTQLLSEHNLTPNKHPQIYRRTCASGQTKLVVPSITAAFIAPWNNTISSTNRLGSYVGTTVYNRSFFRSKRGTFWDFGFNEICFVGGFSQYNNMMSSVINVTAGW
jgi:hypothetical protein